MLGTTENHILHCAQDDNKKSHPEAASSPKDLGGFEGFDRAKRCVTMQHRWG